MLVSSNGPLEIICILAVPFWPALRLAMYIKEVIIDGFKSYGTRTEVRGFDQQFNAITGLNGSGKSNILDAICFVLGITNLKQVSVQQPPVYT